MKLMDDTIRSLCSDWTLEKITEAITDINIKVASKYFICNYSLR